MAKTVSKEKGKKKVETLTHKKASRLNIPTAEYQSVMRTEELSPIRVAYERRNRDLDPQLVWRGKDEQDWSDLVVPAPPLYIQRRFTRKCSSMICSAVPRPTPRLRNLRSISSRISTGCQARPQRQSS